MRLDDYFKMPGSMTASELARAIGIKHSDQVRQWQHQYAGRMPSPENCVAVERATKGMVRRWDLRPADWHLIWPELVGIKGAPRIPKQPKPALAG